MREPTYQELADFLEIPTYLISEAENSSKMIYSIDEPINSEGKYVLKVNKKVVQLATKSLLSDKLAKYLVSKGIKKETVTGILIGRSEYMVIASLDDLRKPDGDEKTYELKYRLKTKDRGYRWFRVACSVLRDNAGNPVQVFGLFIDINDAYELEIANREKLQALQEQLVLRSELNQEKEHLRMFHDIIHSGMWTIDFDDNKAVTNVYWSDEVRKIFGYAGEKEFPNTTEALLNKLHPEDHDKIYNSVMNLLDSKKEVENFDMEYRLLTKEKGYHWFHASGRLLCEDNKRSFFGTLVDTNDAHNNEQLYSVINCLSEDYSCVCHINLETMEEHVYRFDQAYIRNLSGWSEIHSFEERLNLICKKNCLFRR